MYSVMMYDFYPATFAVVYGVILFVLFLIRKFTRRRRNPFIFSALFALYLQCLFKFTMLPILVPLPGEELSMTDAVPWTQFIPFHWLFNGELNMGQDTGTAETSTYSAENIFVLRGCIRRN